MKMGKIQFFIIGISTVTLLLFFAPFLTKGIINIGNVTGILVFGGLLFYGIFMKRFHMLLGRIWQKSGGKFFLAFAAFLISAILITAVIETVCMIKVAGNRPPENTTAIVLGCSVKGTRPSTVLEERIEAAYDYLLKNPKAVCILSGGKGTGEDITEAQCMYDRLIKMGISEERLFLEEKSTSTEENLAFSKEILEEQNLSGELTIITSEFHLYRASIIAEKQGITSYAYPARTFFVLLPTYYVRELYGILQQWFLK